jgi:hypothetical protein
MSYSILSKTKFVLLVFSLVALTSCSFTYSVYRDCDNKLVKVKDHHPKPEWRLGY